MTPSRSALPIALAALLLAAVSAPAAPSGSLDDSSGGLESPENAVRASLVADVRAAAPGSAFRLGIEIRMAEGWHTYWENGGDAGIPTSVEWTLPEGWTAGPIRWPVPHRYEEEGDVVTFGYGDRVLLPVEVRPPAGAPVGGDPVEIRGRVDWLQCKDICIPGGADVAIRIPIESAPRPAPDPVLARFAEAAARHPVPAVSRERIAVWPFQSVDAIPPGETGEAAAVLEGLLAPDLAGAEMYPGPSDRLWFRDGEFRTDGENVGIVIPVEVDASVEPGSVVELPFVLEIPRTDGEPPHLLSLAVPITVAEAGQPAKATPAPVFTGDGPFLDGARADDRTAGTEGPGILLFLLFAFLGGIILNVMPCVLPVISLKILGFVSKSDEDPRKIARLGFVFAAGVIVSFLILAVAVIVLQAAGERIGWGFQFQSPAFVAALAVLVFVFSLSLLGVFEITGLEAIAGRGLGTKARKDYADAFFHGILTTILATPCTAPMLGSAIGFAFSQPPAIILLFFFAAAVGLALPYVLLSMHPAWLKYLPKPGPWMDTFKQIMGFLMLATLVWLVSVFGSQTGTDGLTWLLAFLLVIGFFAWLHGRYLTLTASRRRAAVIWLVTIAGVVWAYRGFLHEPLFAPAEPAYAHDTPGLRSAVHVSKGGTRWEPFSVELLEERVASGYTVFIDFTADWCWTCKVNERTVLADESVERAFAENRVVTLLGDWTRKDAEITEILEKHQRAGVPFYAVYPAGRPEDVIVLPELINKKLVLESLAKAGPSTAPVEPS